MRKSDTLKAAIRFLHETASASDPVDEQMARDFIAFLQLPEPEQHNIEAAMKFLNEAKQ